MKPEAFSSWFNGTASEWEDQYLDRGLRGRHVRKRMDLTMEYIAEEGLPPGARILDLGCGPGIIARELAARGYRVYGVDFSSELLMRSRKHMAGSVSASPHLVQADAHSLPFRDGSFDAVTCIAVMSWVADPGTVLREISRVLRPGGVLVVTAINKYSAEYIFDPLWWWRQIIPAAWRSSLREMAGLSPPLQGQGGGTANAAFRDPPFRRDASGCRLPENAVANDQVRSFPVLRTPHLHDRR